MPGPSTIHGSLDEITYPWEFNAAVAAFYWRSLLLDVEITKDAARSLDDPNLVGTGVVAASDQRR
jgi:hypothetical protein